MLKEGFEDFNGWKEDEKVKSLCIIVPKIKGYKKNLMKLNVLYVFLDKKWNKI